MISLGIQHGVLPHGYTFRKQEAQLSMHDDRALFALFWSLRDYLERKLEDHRRVSKLAK